MYLYIGGTQLDISNGLMKIGITENLHSRLLTYNTGTYTDPFRYRYVFRINSKDIEKEILNLFESPERKIYHGTEFRRNVNIDLIRKHLNSKEIDFESILLNERREYERKENLKDIEELFKIKLNVFQREAVQKEDKYGIIRMPTGTGKFHVGLNLILRSTAVFWCSPYNDILNDQLKVMKKFCRHFNYHLYKGYQGFNIAQELKEPFVIFGNYQTMGKHLSHLKNRIKMFIFDECQLLFGAEFQKILFKPEYFYGLSATPFVNAEQRDLMKNYFDLDIIYDKNLLNGYDEKLIPTPKFKFIYDDTKYFDHIINRMDEWKNEDYKRWAIYFSSIEEGRNFYDAHQNNERIKLYIDNSQLRKDDKMIDISSEPIEDEIIIYCDKGRIGVNIKRLAGIFIARSGVPEPHIIVQILGRPRKELRDTSFITVFLKREDLNHFFKNTFIGIYQSYNNEEIDLYDRIRNSQTSFSQKSNLICEAKKLFGEEYFDEKEFRKHLIKSTDKNDFNKLNEIVRSLRFRTPEEYKENCKEYNLPDNPDDKYKQVWNGWWLFLHYEHERVITYVELKEYIERNKFKERKTYEKIKPDNYPSLKDLDNNYFVGINSYHLFIDKSRR